MEKTCDSLNLIDAFLKRLCLFCHNGMLLSPVVSTFVESTFLIKEFLQYYQHFIIPECDN
jgi:hypothetical protein